ncbi:hypothetical protein [Cellulosimicrobium cellulans]|uniref:hypothetical protein n=1 Tax=Cellulosimicrobium cellulans TaxID=1710 RepID=UPI0008496796|nr:hypothetical protein [Cellulosimicrobium cellulans]
MYLPGTTAQHLNTTQARTTQDRATQARATAAARPAHPGQPAPAPASATPPLTVEWLVARDIDAFSARRRTRPRTPATMDAQASTRPSPVSLRKNGTSAVAQS